MTMLNAGLPTGSVYYVQTQSYTASATIPVPPKCIRIEALLVGGGGSAGGPGGGGGFGGAAIYEIPITGQPLNLVVGAGGSGTRGGITTVSSANTWYAAVGGGGGSSAGVRDGGFCAGGGGGGASPSASGGNGGPPFPGKLLWSALSIANPTTSAIDKFTATSTINGGADTVYSFGSFTSYGLGGFFEHDVQLIN